MDSEGHTTMKLPRGLHRRAVALDGPVVARWGPPPNYRKGGPAAAFHAGIAVLESVLAGEEMLIPAGRLARLEAAGQAAALLQEKGALLSCMLLAACCKVAELQGEDPDARGPGIAAELIRATVDAEIMERESEADPQTAEALRTIARSFLADADTLAGRARPIAMKV